MRICSFRAFEIIAFDAMFNLSFLSNLKVHWEINYLHFCNPMFDVDPISIWVNYNVFVTNFSFLSCCFFPHRWQFGDLGIRQLLCVHTCKNVCVLHTLLLLLYAIYISYHYLITIQGHFSHQYLRWIPSQPCPTSSLTGSRSTWLVTTLYHYNNGLYLMRINTCVSTQAYLTWSI